MPGRKRQTDVVYAPIIGSAAMRAADRVLRAVADKQVTLTFVGESGSGKEVLARRAHELSRRRLGPFIPINCAAIPESLFETELFGHERGAFTGAHELAKGKIEAAAGGTLFLDEIGEMPLAMQAKLLRFLENLRFMRIGGAKKIEADVRLMCATLRPLAEDVRSGRFRADLYYRIQGMTVRVPSLRERREDIGPLIRLFLAQLSARHGVEPPRLTRRTKATLLAYDWPGNVRELRNVVETLCLLRGGRRARESDLPTTLVVPKPETDGGRHRPPSPLVTVNVDDGLDAAVTQIVERALMLERGNPERAANRLRISPRTVQRRLAAGRVRRRG